MKLNRLPILVGALAICAGSAHATWYTTEASFVAALQADYYKETFTGFEAGNQDFHGMPYQSPGANGYSWNASAPSGLFSIHAGLSTDSPDESLSFLFNGKPVAAFGGFLLNTDDTDTSVTETMLLSTGQSMTISDAGFLGWVGDTTLTSVTLSASGRGVGNNFIGIRNAYVDGVAPEPFTMGLGLAGIGLFVRRRAKSMAKRREA